MRLDDLNRLDTDSAARELLRCCGSTRWARMMAAARPFQSTEAMVVTADTIWAALEPADWLEAFGAHPRIGETGAGGAGRAGEAGRAGGADASAGAPAATPSGGHDDPMGLSRRSSQPDRRAEAEGVSVSSRRDADPSASEEKDDWAAHEQAGAAAASDAVRGRLAARNRDYEARFGYIFIVCATGKSADEMLEIIERRLTNDVAVELEIAAEEQRKIIRLRLAKLVDTGDQRTPR